MSKVDKTPRDRNAYIFSELFDSDGKSRNFTTKEENYFVQRIEKEAYESRQKTRNVSGITSHQHNEIDNWSSQILDKTASLNLEEYRNNFAHRLDSLEKLKLELEPANPDSVTQILNVVSTVLDTYKCCFQKILVYTRSEQFSGITDFEYDSLSRLELSESRKQV